MSTFEVRGSGEIQKLSKALKQAGHTELRKQLHKGLKAAAKPLVKEAKDAAKETFPKRGGLAAREGKIPFRSQLLTGSAPGLRIVAPGKYVVGKTVNATGRFRHPVFADGKKTRKEWSWVNQTVPGGRGWFDRRMQDSAPAVRPEIEAAMQRVIDKIVREG